MNNKNKDSQRENMREQEIEGWGTNPKRQWQLPLLPVGPENIKFQKLTNKICNLIGQKYNLNTHLFI